MPPEAEADPNADPTKTKDPTAGDKPAAGKTFTQEELDEIVKTRLGKEKAKFADYDELKKKAKAHDDAADAQKTAEQKARDDADAATKRADEAIAKANARVLRAEIIAKATGKFIDPDDVVALLSAKLTVEDDGTVKGLDDELAALAKAKPHWVKKPATGSQNAGNPAGGGDGGGETEPQQRARLYGSGGNVFDAAAARQHGGGVIFPNDK